MSPSDPHAFVTFASSRPAARCPGTFHRKSGRSLAQAVGLGGFVLLAAALLSASDCIPISEAGDHIGETKCVAGKVLRIRAGVKGVHFLDFCEDESACPFSVVVFPSGLKDVGDIRHLEGRTIE